MPIDLIPKIEPPKPIEKDPSTNPNQAEDQAAAANKDLSDPNNNPNKQTPADSGSDADAPTNSDPANDPGQNPAQDPIQDPVNDPVPDPIQDPVDGPVPDPDPIQDPVNDPDPIQDPVDGPDPDPIQDPVNDPDPIQDPVNDPVPDPDPIQDPVDGPVPDPDPIQDPVNDPVPDPDPDPIQDPVNATGQDPEQLQPDELPDTPQPEPANDTTRKELAAYELRQGQEIESENVRLSRHADTQLQQEFGADYKEDYVVYFRGTSSKSTLDGASSIATVFMTEDIALAEIFANRKVNKIGGEPVVQAIVFEKSTLPSVTKTEIDDMPGIMETIVVGAEFSRVDPDYLDIDLRK